MSIIEPAASLFGPAYTALCWSIRLAMLAILPVRRTPQAATSWLFLILLMPIPGLLLFLAIGRTLVPQSRHKRFLAVAPLIEETAALLEKHALPGVDCQRDVVDFAATLGGFPAVSGNRLTFLDTYDDMIDRLVADIEGATRHVRLLAYIFANDATGTKVVAALARAVGRGVVCHVLIDAVGSRAWRGTRAALRRAGVNAHESLPVSFMSVRRRSDMRNHRKLFIIDGCIGYIGSQNLVEKNFRPGVTNQEMELRVVGPVVAAMTAIFIADWYAETEVMLDSNAAIAPSEGQVWHNYCRRAQPIHCAVSKRCWSGRSIAQSSGLS